MKSWSLGERGRSLTLDSPSHTVSMKKILLSGNTEGGNGGTRARQLRHTTPSSLDIFQQSPPKPTLNEGGGVWVLGDLAAT